MYFVAESDYLSIMNLMITYFSTEEILVNIHHDRRKIIDDFCVCAVSPPFYEFEYYVETIVAFWIDWCFC